ncbi:hypothetical protein MD484_g938, partial [Candolleomyces efflorescens]
MFTTAQGKQKAVVPNSDNTTQGKDAEENNKEYQLPSFTSSIPPFATLNTSKAIEINTKDVVNQLMSSLAKANTKPKACKTSGKGKKAAAPKTVKALAKGKKTAKEAVLGKSVIEIKTPSRSKSAGKVSGDLGLRTLHLLQEMADREATKFRAKQHFISSYVAMLKFIKDPFLDQLLNKDTVTTLISEFSASAYEKQAIVLFFCEYLMPPNLFKAGIAILASAPAASLSPEPEPVHEEGLAPKDNINLLFKDQAPAETMELLISSEGEKVFEAEAGHSSSS